jgi:hypothetical protein
MTGNSGDLSGYRRVREEGWRGTGGGRWYGEWTVGTAEGVQRRKEAVVDRVVRREMKLLTMSREEEDNTCRERSKKPVHLECIRRT